MRCAALTHPGHVRQTNEDRWFADAESGLYLIADGMASHHGGGVASQAITELLVERLLKVAAANSTALDETMTRRLADTVAEFSREMHAETAGRVGLHGMGAAIVFLLVRGSTCLVGHMGDCRAYLMREGGLQQLTDDHTLARYLQEAGLSTSDSGQAHGRLTRFVGMPDTVPPDFQLIDSCAGDRILLCSDGVNNCLDDGELSRILAQESSLNQACEQIINSALANAAPDNLTALLIGA